MWHVMSVPSFMFPNFSISLNLLSSAFMHANLRRNISYCEIQLKCMLSFRLESFIFWTFKVRTYRTVPSHTGFCGYYKLDQSYYVDWRHLATDCWCKCPYIIKLFLLWNVQNIVEVSVFLWCGNLSVGDWWLMFWSTVIVSSSREEKAFAGCFDPWRWDHHTLSKH